MIPPTLKIALVSLINKRKNYCINKDLNGGAGTADDYDGSWGARLIRFARKNITNLPVSLFGNLQAIFKQLGHDVIFIETHDLSKITEKFDLLLIYGSIVDYNHENEQGEAYKNIHPDTKVGYCGSFPAAQPHLFIGGDFVVKGEAEYFFLKEFNNLDQLTGHVPVSALTDLNDIPSPNLDGFPINKFSYSPAILTKPFFFIQSSFGCPYSCRYYCTYGEYQGPKIRQRSAVKVVQDMTKLKEVYGIQALQFRDPIFGLEKGFIEDLCFEIKKQKLQIEWGIETRLDLLNEEIISKMQAVGLVSINCGIETPNEKIAKANKRKLVAHQYQENIINFCNKRKINITAFFILGLETDTIETINQTISYALSLNIDLARFSVSTPYPGTRFFDDLKKNGKLLTEDYEQYSQFRLVYKHDHLSPEDVRILIGKAYQKFYFRPTFLIKRLLKKLTFLHIFNQLN